MENTKVNQKFVLLIEDELELANMLKEAFEQQGIKVIHAIDQVNATAMTNNQLFDLIISDINLARGTGDKVIKNIRRNPHNPNFKTPIVVISAQLTNATMEEIGKFLNKAIVKPFSPKEVLDYSMSVISA